MRAISLARQMSRRDLMIGDRRAQPVSEFLANPLPGPLTLGAADNDCSFGVQDVAP
jgi:hypothetical protein